MHLQDSASVAQRRLQRHLSHTRATYAHFIKHLCRVGDLKPEVAEAAAISVVSALERRIQPGQARHLEAQLPRRLVAFLPPDRMQGAGGVRRFGRDAFLQTVADDLHMDVADDLRMDVAEVEPLVRAVIAGLRDRISEGQADDVANNLPEDMRALWRLSQ